MDRELYNFTRGTLARTVYGKETDFHSIREPITDLMSRVEGANLVSAQRGIIPDQFEITYFISPEGATMHFNVGINIRIRAYAADSQVLEKTYNKMQRALGIPLSAN